MVVLGVGVGHGRCKIKPALGDDDRNPVFGPVVGLYVGILCCGDLLSDVVGLICSVGVGACPKGDLAGSGAGLGFDDILAAVEQFKLKRTVGELGVLKRLVRGERYGNLIGLELLVGNGHGVAGAADGNTVVAAGNTLKPVLHVGGVLNELHLGALRNARKGQRSAVFELSVIRELTVVCQRGRSAVAGGVGKAVCLEFVAQVNIDGAAELGVVGFAVVKTGHRFGDGDGCRFRRINKVCLQLRKFKGVRICRAVDQLLHAGGSGCSGACALIAHLVGVCPVTIINQIAARRLTLCYLNLITCGEEGVKVCRTAGLQIKISV